MSVAVAPVRERFFFSRQSLIVSPTRFLDFSSQAPMSDNALAASLPSTGATLNKSSFPLYKHQVAGHFPLLWREQAIYKPAQPGEAEFYSNMARFSSLFTTFHGLLHFSMLLLCQLFFVLCLSHRKIFSLH
jgi:hypothetical protein